jgi:pyruvate dehydrogenase E2 component (dihydrolipoamide acetyltransferase)
MAEFRMPSLGADMDAGTLAQWLVEPGDTVERGDVVAVVETQKGAIDVEIFESGTISKLLIEEGTEVPVGTVLALLNGAGAAEAVAPAEVVPEAPVEAPAEAVAEVPAPPVVEAPAGEGRQRVSPLARRRAAELGVDLAQVRGTGPDGAVTVADIEAAAAPAVPATPPAEVPETDRQAAMRAAIAAAMSRSNREIPHYYLATEIDMTRALAWLEATNRDRPVTERVLYAALLVKAVARAVAEAPEMNGWNTEDGFRPGEHVHAGIAISLRRGGLVVPAILGAEALTVDEVMAKLSDLILRAREGRLRSSELSEGTITITSLGEQGVPAVYGVIFPPQVALVGFGAIAMRPWVTEDGGIEARPVMTATLAADHRVSDGHRGGHFLAAIDRWLQTPEEL